MKKIGYPLIPLFALCSLQAADVMSVNFRAGSNNSAILKVNPSLAQVKPIESVSSLLEMGLRAGSNSQNNVLSSTLDVSVSCPVVGGVAGTEYNYSFMRGGAQTGNDTNNIVLELSDIPYSDYYVIVYVSGWGAGAVTGNLSDGTSTYYYDFEPVSSSGSPGPQLKMSADESSADGYDAGNFFVFGRVASPLSGASMTITLNQDSGTVILGGFQIVEITTPASLDIFDEPDNLTKVPPSSDYEIYVDGQEVFCYANYRFDPVDNTTDINNRPVSPLSYSVFDFDGPLTVELLVEDGLISDPENVVIRPLSLGIVPRVAGNFIRFDLAAPGNVTVEPNGDGLNALHLFTNTPEVSPPGPTDPGVVYYGPGVHDVSSISLASNETLYLAGGAFLRFFPALTGSPGPVNKLGYDYYNAQPAIKMANGSSIQGRGIISGVRAFANLMDLRRFNMIKADGKDDVTINDIVITDASAWTVSINASEDVVIDGIRILGYFENSDGICFDSSNDCIARNAFVHNADDGLEVKAWNSSTNILFEDCQIWSDAGAPMGLTGEILGDVSYATWSRITVLRYTKPVGSFAGRGAIMLNCPAGGTVSDILFDDITIESISGGSPVILVSNFKLGWNGAPVFTSEPYSTIADVTISDVVVHEYNSAQEIVIRDATEVDLITNLAFEEVDFAGTVLDEFNAPSFIYYEDESIYD